MNMLIRNVVSNVIHRLISSFYATVILLWLVLCYVVIGGLFEGCRLLSE